MSGGPVALLGAGVALLLALLSGAAAAGALFWRVRASEARIRVVELAAAEAARVDADFRAAMSGQLAALDATIRGLSKAVDDLAKRL